MCKNDLDIIITCYFQMYCVVNPEWRVLLSSLRPFSAPASVQRTHKIRARSPSQNPFQPFQRSRRALRLQPLSLKAFIPLQTGTERDIRALYLLSVDLHHVHWTRSRSPAYFQSAVNLFSHLNLSSRRCYLSASHWTALLIYMSVWPCCFESAIACTVWAQKGIQRSINFD